MRCWVQQLRTRHVRVVMDGSTLTTVKSRADELCHSFGIRDLNFDGISPFLLDDPVVLHLFLAS